jgi:2-iminobutanoate/2-iminopropanoate deaminase
LFNRVKGRAWRVRRLESIDETRGSSAWSHCPPIWNGGRRRLQWATRSGNTIYVSGLPPFDPETGEVVDAPIERQAELVLQQMKLCLETAESSLENVVKCNVYCTSVDNFAVVNAIYTRYFSKDLPARIFVCVPTWPGHFDIEIDCVAAV